MKAYTIEYKRFGAKTLDVSIIRALNPNEAIKVVQAKYRFPIKVIKVKHFKL